MTEITGEVSGSVEMDGNIEGEESSLSGAVYGARGEKGYSAYELAVRQGYRGTEQEWIASLKGNTGDTGATPSITIGTVTTLPAGSEVEVEITGTPENPVLSFAIPKGVAGGAILS